jgi:hypothetical protein
MCQIDHKVPVYIFVVFYEGRVCFCVGAQLSEQTFPRSWVARELQPGDLSRLTDFALFRNRRPASVVVDRLCERRIYGDDQAWAPQDDTERLDGYPSAKNTCSKKRAQLSKPKK